VTAATGSRAGPSRRTLLRLAAGAGLATVTTPGGARVAFGAPGDDDVLVILSLRGGFDGLTAVPPVGDPDYRRLRPESGVPQEVVKPVDGTFGLHPALGALFPFWDAGVLAAVHAVGQPSATRSHESATAELERGGPASVRGGWVDRTLGVLGQAGLFAGTQAGVPLPASLAGPHDKVALGRLADLRLPAGAAPDVWQRATSALFRGAKAEATRPTTAGLRALGGLGDLAGQPADAVAAGYPGGGPGVALHDVARLVRAGVGVRVATLDVDGWDFHADAGRHDAGPLRDRLDELARALAAFVIDLGGDFGRVTLVTLTEFGRRAAENGSGGTDHGHGTAALVLGGAVRGGRVYGRWPGLADDRLANGDLAGTTDYRSILAEVLDQRLRVSSTGPVFPGFRPVPLGLVNPR
jgi:uncharacterized protein (DUF1501 family)